MAKVKNKKRFGRDKSQRKALMQSLSRNLILHERIKTTEAKAKELQSFLEPLITEAKKGGMQARRKLSKHFDDKAIDKLMEEIAPDYEDREGGYTRIIKIGSRTSDKAKEVFIELV